MPATSSSKKTHDVVSNDLEIARALFGSGAYEEVLSFTDDAIPRASNPRESFALHLQRAAAYGEREDYRSALDVLQKAGGFIDRASPMSKGRFYCQRAYLLVKLGRCDDALVDYEEARVWAQESGDRITEATSRNNIARQYSKADRLDEAIIESDAAIAIGKTLADDWRLGRYYDQRAQILVDHDRFSEAIPFCERAVNLLADNPSAVEARETYGRAILGLLRNFTTREDPIEGFRARRWMATKFAAGLDEQTTRTALERSNGHVFNAAALLNITHAALLKAIKRYGLQDLQQRKLRKSIIKKNKSCELNTK